MDGSIQISVLLCFRVLLIMMNEKLIFGVILSLEIVCSSCRPWRVPRGRFRLCRSTARCSAVRLVYAFLAAGCIDVPSLAAVVTSGVLVGTILLTMVRASAAIAWLAAVAVGLISTLELCTLCTQLMGWDWSFPCATRWHPGLLFLLRVRCGWPSSDPSWLPPVTSEWWQGCSVRRRVDP